jgi:hypothetical protein
LIESQNGTATIAQIPARRDQTIPQHSMANQVSYASSNRGNLSYSQQPFANTQFQNQSYANQPQMIQPYYGTPVIKVDDVRRLTGNDRLKDEILMLVEQRKIDTHEVEL